MVVDAAIAVTFQALRQILLVREIICIVSVSDTSFLWVISCLSLSYTLSRFLFSERFVLDVAKDCAFKICFFQQGNAISWESPKMKSLH